ncbi:MAG: hypothetical protein GF417_14180 [Candidatus Latescibacteria bacterium]|nr:hypothetical protein [bacterium]MBD3425579.1 hypothetical protein [Candidatus Latescibacterota bacterium]
MGGFLFSLFISLFFIFIFAVLAGRRGPWDNIAVFFLVVFLATWGIGSYLRFLWFPVMGVYWLPYFLVALLFSLLLASILSEKQSERKRGKLSEAPGQKAGAGLRLGLFFWLFIAVLVILIIAIYLFPVRVT